VERPRGARPQAARGSRTKTTSMDIAAAIRREFVFLVSAARTLARLRTVKSDGPRLATDDLEAAVDRYADRPAFIFEGRETSYGELDAYANKVAHWADAQGMKRGDTVALFMLNRPEYIAIWFGLSKIGVITALLNTQLSGAALAHSINISEARLLIVDAEIAHQLADARGRFESPIEEWASGGAVADARDFAAAIAAASPERPPRARRQGMVGKDIVLKIYTSGTTGMPKAARIAHVKVLNYMNAFAAAFDAQPDDRMLMVLPLYHATGGLVGVGVVLVAGGCVILEQRFSASHFWDVAVDNGATLFTYVGELCRFLVAAPEHQKERAHQIRGAVGNGLRPDVWERFVKRFQIPWIIEFYGSTEGNVSLINFDGHPGAIGRVPPYLAHRFNARILKFDHETEQPARGPDGFCIAAAPDEVGEAVGEIRPGDARYAFAGYAGAPKETEKKILRNVFKTGDVWFRTGDLLRQDRLGYFYFVDRVGDTYRWKSENVSTSEVSEVLGRAPGVVQANVYGVEIPGYDGRAGMAALITEAGFDLAALHAHVHARLAPFARPAFLRIHGDDIALHTTGTFKMRKVDLVREGFDPARVKEALYLDDPRANAYVRLDAALYREIVEGGVRL
jgi:fatty-acyl-CoA synthase